jgi:hypothetical protein
VRTSPAPCATLVIMRAIGSGVLLCLLAAAAGSLGCGARTDIGVECVSDVGKRPGPSCGAGRARAISGIVSTDRALGVFTAQCGVVYVAVSYAPSQFTTSRTCCQSWRGGSSPAPICSS